jgi:hypothetical protein
VGRDIRAERVIRIRRILTFFGYYYVKYVVDFRYFVDGKGPYNIHMEPFNEPPEDTEKYIKGWKRSGCPKTYE